MWLCIKFEWIVWKNASQNWNVGRSIGNMGYVVSIFYSNISRLYSNGFMFCDTVCWQIVKKFHASAYRKTNGDIEIEIALHACNRHRSRSTSTIRSKSRSIKPSKRHWDTYGHIDKTAQQHADTESVHTTLSNKSVPNKTTETIAMHWHNNNGAKAH